MKTLPDNLDCYKKTPEFTEQTVPAGLLNNHNTKAGTWGEIVVLGGQLEYTILEPETQTHILTPENSGIVEPEVLHRVKPLGSVRFYVAFYR